ncbi:MAG: DegQ family serine endoprotease [Pseudomonadales bacterium]|jgi:serine protease DegQ|nr:DegQ family serine endoprotease [Pseudomonadales bacterium]
MKLKTQVPALLFVAAVGGMSLALSPLTQAADATRPSVAPMLQEVTPAVVNIAVSGHTAEEQSPLLNDQFFRRFFENQDPGQPQPQQPQQPQRQQPRQRQTQAVGSGVIIDAEAGYILTNHHVVAGAEDISVTLTDKRRLSAKLIGSDPGTDVALLQIDAEGLSAVPLADSETLRVGDFVAAIGNPFGLGQTVTTGIVSALDRAGINAEGYEDFIQTDASINPGNSGGALVDYDGKLVGINTAIIAPSGGNVGIGFAVPINMAKSVVDQLIEYGSVQRGMLGVQITDLTPDVAEALELKATEGAVVQSVTPDSPALAAGLQAGDVIVDVNGAAIEGASDLRNTIGLIRAGETVRIGFLRGDARQEVSATIAPGNPTQVASAQGVQNSVLEGASFSAVPADDPDYGDLDGGVLVSTVDQDSRAWNNGLRAGDVITAVNRRPVSGPDDLQEQLGNAERTVALNILRGGQSLFLILR